MPVVKAYIMPHPPLAVPQIGRGQERGIPQTLKSFEESAADIARTAPETIIFITPHSTLYADHFHISPGNSAKGDFGRFRAQDVRIETEYDRELIDEISKLAKLSGISAGTEGEREPALDHGVMVPMWYINKHYTQYKSIRISQSGMDPAEHYMLGQIISKAADVTGRKTVVIGSSDLSHRLAADGPYGYAPEGGKFDKTVTDALESGDFLALFNIPEKLREKAAECGYRSLMVTAGLFDCRSVEARLLSYEGTYGVGYAIAHFTPLGEDKTRNILGQYLDKLSAEINSERDNEDDYQKLARWSLEHKIRTGDKLPVPNGLPEEMIRNKAGVFVSLHKYGSLRGCIGTIAPTTKNIAEEIIQNAVSAGLSDTRFSPVTEDELAYLTVKVDVLKAPEDIDGPDELDVKRYGVIVSSGMRRGLLLPNLDGVDTVEEQINIARSKGGISEGEPVKLRRFEVIRHE